jgi:hypothetical protein
MATAELRGLDQLKREMTWLTIAVARRLSSNVAMAGARVVGAEARQLLPIAAVVIGIWHAFLSGYRLVGNWVDSHRRVGLASTAVSHRADLPWTGLDWAGRDPIRTSRQGRVRRRSPTSAGCCCSPDSHPRPRWRQPRATAGTRRFPWPLDRAIMPQ